MKTPCNEIFSGSRNPASDDNQKIQAARITASLDKVAKAQKGSVNCHALGRTTPGAPSLKSLCLASAQTFHSEQSNCSLPQ